MISNSSRRCFLTNFWCPQKSGHETLFMNIVMKCWWCKFYFSKFCWWCEFLHDDVFFINFWCSKFLITKLYSRTSWWSDDDEIYFSKFYCWCKSFAAMFFYKLLVSTKIRTWNFIHEHHWRIYKNEILDFIVDANPSRRCFFINFWCPEKSDHETLFTNIMMKWWWWWNLFF
jgi:hypothetical protein